MLKVTLCILPVCKTCRSAPDSLVFCVLSMLKIASCIYLCVRPVKVPGCLSFAFLIEFANSEALREKLTYYLLVKRKVTCVDDNLLINFFCGVNSTSYSMVPGLMSLLLLVVPAQPVFWSGAAACTPWIPIRNTVLGILFTVGQLHLGQITFGPTPPPSKDPP